MDVRGKKVTVVGMGRTALALVRLLLREGATPFVTDAGDKDKLSAYCDELDRLGVAYECGGHTDAAVDGAVLVIPSPGVPPQIPVIQQARDAGADVVGEMEFASAYCGSRILAVTGTNGKTTTTELLKTLVEACGESVILAGNNDNPLSAAVMLDPAPDFIVLEVSSYQLETVRSFRPWIGAVLNVTPDHLARHGTLDEYAAVKQHMFACQTADDHAVVNRDDVRTRCMADGAASTGWQFSLTERVDRGLWLDGSIIRDGDVAIAWTTDVRLPGRHNLENVLCALTMMRAGRFDWEATLSGLRSFGGVEHRIEFVAALRGVEFYNDSKSTNIDSLKVALESFSAPVILIAGGEGKGTDYSVLSELVKERVKHLVTIGEDAPLLEAAFGADVAHQRAADMDEATAMAAAAADSGDIVLLSPACASFDMFDNFEHRGTVFKDCVRAYVARRDDASQGTES